MSISDDASGKRGKRQPILYLHERGKADGAERGGEIEDLVQTGATVLAIDLRGMGETREDLDRTDAFFNYFGAFESAMTAMLVGKANKNQDRAWSSISAGLRKRRNFQ